MNRKVLLISVVAAFVAVVAWMFLLYRPAGDDLDEAQRDLTTVSNELSQVEVQLSRLRDVEADLPRLQSGIETLRAAVPDDAGLADFILGVNEAALGAGVEVDSIAPDVPRNGSSGLTEINVGLKTSGGYYKVLDFLNRLSGMHRVVTVETINLSAERGDNPAAEPALAVTIAARIYVNPVAAAPEVDPTSTPDSAGSENS